jgi:hypothetical protein
VNTRIDYMYRDGANWQSYGHAVLAGELSDADRALIRENLDSGEYFIPSQVGLPDLQYKDATYYHPDYDHVWHELNVDEDFEPTNAPPTVQFTAHEFAERFRDIVWDDGMWATARLILAAPGGIYGSSDDE